MLQKKHWAWAAPGVALVLGLLLYEEGAPPNTISDSIPSAKKSMKSEVIVKTKVPVINRSMKIHGVEHIHKGKSASVEKEISVTVKSEVDRIVDSLMSGDLEPGQISEASRQALKQRLEVLATWVIDDPQKALDNRLPIAFLKQFAHQLPGLTEEWVEGQGTLALMAECSEEKHHFYHDAVFDDRQLFLKASVYGERLKVQTRERAPLHGIAVDGTMAVHENGIRLLEVGESEYQAGIIMARMGERILSFDNSDEYQSFVVKINALELSTSGPDVNYEEILAEYNQ